MDFDCFHCDQKIPRDANYCPLCGEETSIGKQFNKEEKYTKISTITVAEIEAEIKAIIKLNNITIIIIFITLILVTYIQFLSGNDNVQSLRYFKSLGEFVFLSFFCGFYFWYISLPVIGIIMLLRELIAKKILRRYLRPRKIFNFNLVLGYAIIYSSIFSMHRFDINEGIGVILMFFGIAIIIIGSKLPY